MPAVSIVIVCMNRPDNLGPCLDSIKQHTTSEYEVYVVAYRFSADNLSAMKAAYPWVNFIINNSISGFSENNNLALKEVKSEYCFILNDDTELPGPTIDKLIADFRALPPDAAIVAAKLLNADGSLQLCGRPDYPPFRYVLQQWHLYSEPTDNGKGLFRTFNVSGAAFLIKTAIFKELGWFDERYFFTPEDIAHKRQPHFLFRRQFAPLPDAGGGSLGGRNGKAHQGTHTGAQAGLPHIQAQYPEHIYPPLSQANLHKVLQ